MLFHKLKPHTVEVSDALVKSFKGAHMKYKSHLAEKKEKQVLSEADNKLYISNYIEKLRSNVRVMEKAVSMMNTKIFECMLDKSMDGGKTPAIVIGKVPVIWR